MADITVSGPDGSTFSFPAGTSTDVITGAMRSHYGSAPQPIVSPVSDFLRSIPGGIVGGISNALSTGGQAAQIEMGQPVDVPSTPQTKQIVEQNITGQLPEPQGRAGRFGQTVGEFVGNPSSYIGPGSLPLKVGGAVLGGLGSEAGGQAAEGTRYEGVARVAGALAGGGLAAKALGPSIPEAAIPTRQELFGSGDAGYKKALQSGLELNPNGVAQFASKARQDLSNGPEYAFTGGSTGTAPKTFAALEALENAPANSTVSAANLNTLRIHLNDIASEVQPTGSPGVSKPTSDAVAAMALKERLASYLENLPQDHVVAGDPEAYRLAIKQANGDWAAGSRLANVDARLTKAENTFARQIAGSRDRLIRTKIGTMLDNPQKLRGLSPEEIQQIQLVNDGTTASNTLSQLGRGGTGVIPIGAHVGAAYATGGASIPASLAIGIPLYLARKGAEKITMSRAQELADMIAKRSPLYQSRVNALPAADTMSGKAAVLRALLNGTSGQ